MAAYTSSNYLKHTHPNVLYRASIERFNARLLAVIDKARPASVLEAGCGEGFLLNYLAKQRPDIRWEGCDISRPAIAFARQLCPPHVALSVADIYRLPGPPASYDLVLCSEVLEHLTDVPAALAELRRVSKRFVLVTVPREPYFHALTLVAVMLGLGRDPGHRQFWTASAFRRLMGWHFRKVDMAYSTGYQLALAEKHVVAS